MTCPTNAFAVPYHQKRGQKVRGKMSAQLKNRVRRTKCV